MAYLVVENPTELQRALELQRRAGALLEILDGAVISIRAGTFKLPVAPALAREAIRRMEAVRAQVSTMENAEDLLLAKRLTLTATAHRAAVISVVSLAALAICLVIFMVLIDRRARAIVHRSREWLATILTSIGDGVIATDASGSVRFLNPVASDFTGWTQAQAQARGRPIEEVFCIVGESDHVPAESPVTRVGAPDRSRGRWHGPLGGCAVRVIGILRDITDNMRLEQQVPPNPEVGCLGHAGRGNRGRLQQYPGGASRESVSAARRSIFGPPSHVVSSGYDRSL